jgi:hypothetical protein
MGNDTNAMRQIKGGVRRRRVSRSVHRKVRTVIDNRHESLPLTLGCLEHAGSPSQRLCMYWHNLVCCLGSARYASDCTPNDAD